MREGSVSIARLLKLSSVANSARFLLVIVAVLAACAVTAAPPPVHPRVVVISLDGATPSLISEFMQDGTIPDSRGIGLLARYGTTALRNVTTNPSLTAAAHIAIATGSTAVRNDIPSNSFHLVGGAFGLNISGFGAPIGGYDFHHLGEAADPTAEPLWLANFDGTQSPVVPRMGDNPSTPASQRRIFMVAMVMTRDWRK